MTYCRYELPKLQKSSSDGTTPSSEASSSSFDTSGSHNHLLMLTRWGMGDGSGSDLLTSSIAVEATVRARFCSFEIDPFSASVRQGGAGRLLHPRGLRDASWTDIGRHRGVRLSVPASSSGCEDLGGCPDRGACFDAEGQAPGPFSFGRGNTRRPSAGVIAADCCGGPYSIGSSAHAPLLQRFEDPLRCGASWASRRSKSRRRARRRGGYRR
jgi:hypothetical protein